MSDPAIVDRASVYIGPVAPSDLPSRAMQIAGLNMRFEARILSRHAKGAATRLVAIPPGWVTDQRGCFDADVELFVLRGSLAVAGVRAGPHSLVIAQRGELVESLECRNGVTALMATSAPTRFDVTADTDGAATVVMASEIEWSIDEYGLVTKTFEGPGPMSTRLVVAGHFAAPGWARLDCWSERLILDGGWWEHVGDLSPAEPVLMGPMQYVSRPAGTKFEGPKGGAAAVSVFLDRSEGPWAPVSCSTDEIGDR